MLVEASSALPQRSIITPQIGKANPWQKQAIKIVTGSKETAYKPLTEILEGQMNLKIDKIIDISGVTKGA